MSFILPEPIIYPDCHTCGAPTSPAEIGEPVMNLSGRPLIYEGRLVSAHRTREHVTECPEGHRGRVIETLEPQSVVGFELPLKEPYLSEYNRGSSSPRYDAMLVGDGRSEA